MARKADVKGGNGDVVFDTETGTARKYLRNTSTVEKVARFKRELADDHPLKQIYEKRLNTINRYVKRGTLDADLAEVMKKLAKDKMLRALSNVAYAKGDYEKEMGQAALKKEAKLRTK